MCTDRCFVTIHLVPGAAPTNLNLVEVELYDLHGIQIRDNLTALQSSMLNNYGGFACIDGKITDSIYDICHTQDDDPFPFLRIGYPCSGQTLGSLSRVVVYNRRDCCQFRTLSFMLDFQRLSKTALVEVDQDVMPYRFADAGEAQLNYTINITRVANGEHCKGGGGGRAGMKFDHEPHKSNNLCKVYYAQYVTPSTPSSTRTIK